MVACLDFVYSNFLVKRDEYDGSLGKRLGDTSILTTVQPEIPPWSTLFPGTIE
jgi:hypothetical protein